jgi:nucleotide-binding universal stress UspA family protein
VSESVFPGEVLALVDGSPASQAAAALGTQVASALSRPLAILGVSGSEREHSAISQAISDARAAASSKVPSVEAIEATGEILEVAERRVLRTTTALVVLGWNPRSDGPNRRPGVWRLANSLAPPVLVVPPGSIELKRFLFCTGGERYIEEGARFTAWLAAALKARVTAFHVLPHAPEIYGDWVERGEEEPEEFLQSGSRLARNIGRQLEIFRAAGLETGFHTATGEVVSSVLREVRRDRIDLLIVGSPAASGAIRSYMLGDVTREIASQARVPFLVVRSKQPGFWAELWRALTEQAAESLEPGKLKQDGRKNEEPRNVSEEP